MASKSPTSRSNTLTFRSKIREELICAVCLDFLITPKVLNCAHSFCLECLDRIVTTNCTFKYGPGSDLEPGDLECPSCRQVTKLGSGGVSELKTNYNLKRLVSIVSEDDKKNARDMLQRRRTQRPSISNNRSRCQHHHRPVEYFCLDCNDLLCPKCISSSHKGHNFDDIDKLLPSQISALRSLIQPACEVANRAEGMIEQLFQEKGKVTKNAHKTSDCITSYFQTIRAVLDQRESALRSTVQKYGDIRLSRLDAHYQMLRNHHSTILARIDDIESLIETNDNTSLLRQKQAISEEVEVQEQSIMRLADLLKESCDNGSLLFQVGQSSSAFSELGTLNERQQKDGCPFVTLRRVVISEDEDPYLDVPLRFEDEENVQPQKHMRVESEKVVEYEPDNKPKFDFDNSIYNVPRSNAVSSSNYNVPRSSNGSNKPKIPPRKSSVPKLPPVPPRHKIKRSQSSNDASTVTSSEWQRDYQNAPLTLPRTSETDTSEWSRDYQNYPSLPLNVSQGDTSNPHSQKWKTIPARKSAPYFVPILRQVDSDEDIEDYEPIDIDTPPIPAPRTKPPPLPPNHPSRTAPPTKPKPRRRSGTTAVPPSPADLKNPKLKRRSNTLPPEPTLILSPPPSPQREPIILPPLYVIGKEKLSSPFRPEMVYPNGVCCCTNLHDTLIVTDVYNHCLRLIDSRGTFIEKIGKEGRSGGQFKEPSAVTVDADNYIFVAERDNPRIQKFTVNGKYVSKFGQKTLLGNQLGDPIGVALSADKSVVVSDWEKSKICVFSSSGKLIKTIGKENNLFKFPAGIAMSKKGHLLVTDRGNHCVWEITFSGDLIQKIGSKGSTPGKLYFPYGVSTLKDGTVLITESGNNRVSVFSAAGKFIRCFGQLGSEPGQFDHPRHVCVNSKGHVIVADEMNQRLQVFQV